MNAIVTRSLALLGLGLALVTSAAVSAQQAPPAEPKLPRDINKSFENPDVPQFVGRFETESREVFAKRDAIVKSLGLKPGQVVADVGAGTGLFTRLIADKVGSTGKVVAVDISAKFLEHIASESKKLGQTQVATVLGTQTDAKLDKESVDMIYICDVYHHVEKPTPWLASLLQGLKPGGSLVLIEFDRAEGKASDFIKKHVRASREQFVKEFVAAGFQTVDTPDAPAFRENFYQRFLKPASR